MHTVPINILAVDDEKLLLWALERACEGRSLNLKTVVSTKEALEMVDLCHFDLFLLDFDLRDPSRLELLEGINQRCPYVPIIIMTTADTKSCELNDAIREVRKQGAWHLIEKPFSLDRMLSFIEIIFQEQTNVKLCLNDLSHNYENEKRRKFRRHHVQAVEISFKSISEGEHKKNLTTGILTDISDTGLGLLTQSPLKLNQVINFGDSLQQQCGVVVWSRQIEAQTCRVGIRLC
jgi:DNA-binding NtrC family response regulator